MRNSRTRLDEKWNFVRVPRSDVTGYAGWEAAVRQARVLPEAADDAAHSGIDNVDCRRGSSLAAKRIHPMQSKIKDILNVVVVIVVVLRLLNVFGALHSLANIRAG
jgi:hypothetical protein